LFVVVSSRHGREEESASPQKPGGKEG